MIKGRKTLTLDSIMEYVNDEDIFKWYMPHSWKINIRTNSPFREDSNPSFIIGNKKGYLRFIDFGNTSLKGNCIDFVMKLYGLSYTEALNKIYDDMIGGKENLMKRKTIETDGKEKKIREVKYSNIQVVKRQFTLTELKYWNKYGISEDDLIMNNVYSIKDIYLNGNKVNLKPLELRFGYSYDDSWKIYRPYSSAKDKWFPNNVPITTMEGLENLSKDKYAFINKSKKDHMVISKFIDTSCAVQNEGFACFSEDNIRYLKENSNRQILSFDSDRTGVENSIQITRKFGWDYCNVPRSYLSDGIVDWADVAEGYGLQTVEKILKRKKLI